MQFSPNTSQKTPVFGDVKMLQKFRNNFVTFILELGKLWKPYTLAAAKQLW